MQCYTTHTSCHINYLPLHYFPQPAQQDAIFPHAKSNPLAQVAKWLGGTGVTRPIGSQVAGGTAPIETIYTPEPTSGIHPL